MSFSFLFSFSFSFLFLFLFSGKGRTLDPTDRLLDLLLQQGYNDLIKANIQWNDIEKINLLAFSEEKVDNTDNVPTKLTGKKLKQKNQEIQDDLELCLQIEKVTSYVIANKFLDERIHLKDEVSDILKDFMTSEKNVKRVTELKNSINMKKMNGKGSALGTSGLQGVGENVRTSTPCSPEVPRADPFPVIFFIFILFLSSVTLLTFFSPVIKSFKMSLTSSFK